MGFRTTLLSEDANIDIPQWFDEKYPELKFAQKDEKKRLSIAILDERKFYDKFQETALFLDIQKVLKEAHVGRFELHIVLLHECGGITKITITADKIVGLEPLSWKTVDKITHDYCYGCSDPPKSYIS